MPQPFILISNDDGIQAEGIRVLASALKKIGRVAVVAPDRQQSASSHSITLHRPLRAYRQSEWEYAVDGTPTDCVTLAVHVLFKRKPDLIVSGINNGANLCDDVHYSGTVSAATEGALLGIPALAVSLVSYDHPPFHFETAARVARRLSQKVLKEKLPVGSVLNVNVPNVPFSKIKGYAWTKLGKRNYGSVIVKKRDPRGRDYYWIGGDDRNFLNISGSDGVAIQKNRVTITPLQVDLTHYPLLEEMRQWKI